MQQEDIVGALIRRMVLAVVDSTAAVRVDKVVEGSVTTYRVQVAKNDLGHVIGKQGRTARALRVILTALAMKQKRRLELDIVTESATECAAAAFGNQTAE